MFEPLIGEQVGKLLTDGLDQFGLRDVVEDETGDAVYIPWKDDRKSSFRESREQHVPGITKTRR